MVIIMSTKMLCTPASTQLLPLLPPRPISRRLTCCINPRNHQTLIKLSGQDEIIEHVVLYKVKPDVDSSKVAAMVSGLNNLKTSLTCTIHVSAGKLLRSSSFPFTHMLHTRYRSMDDLRQYRVHPEHVRLRMETVKPIIDDVMSVDWISDCGSVSPKPGSAMRVTFLKLKDGLSENEKAEVLEVVGGIRDEFESIEQLSFGENFSHDRAKGYTIASIAVFPDLEALDLNEQLINLHKVKAKDLIESELVVDYVCPPAM